jgi:ssDNA thymidine ADP-ribosyltransferase, DarT
MPMPAAPKLYHIVHVDRLPSVIADGFLWSDAEIARRARPGTVIGMNSIKRRRLSERLVIDRQSKSNPIGIIDGERGRYD